MMLDSPFRVLFRCDASVTLGGGHVMRCLTLADALRKRGCSITFACTAESVRTVPELDSGGHDLIMIDGADDAAELSGSGARWDAAVIDHYALGADYERTLRGVADAIVVVDDLADRVHDCDVLLDQTFGREPAEYDGLVPPLCKLLLGPRFALVRQEFAAARSATLVRRRTGGPLGRILISMGLTDLGGVTAQVAKAVLSAGLDVGIDVAIGRSAPSLSELAALARNDRRLQLHVDCSDICTLMAECDIAIGAGGTTSWERCCLGAPTLMMVLADNQATIARNLAEAGAVRLVMPDQADQLTHMLCDLAQNSSMRLAMVEAAAEICDGRGARRVSDIVSGAIRHGGPLLTRRAEARDARDIWSWRNDPIARAASGTTDLIAWEDHCVWFTGALADETRAMYVIEVRGQGDPLPIGVVRVEPWDAEKYRVSISLNPDFRGTGMGRAALAAGLESFEGEFGVHRLVAEIRATNSASRRIFEDLGFQCLAGTSVDTDADELEHFERPSRSLQAIGRNKQP